MRPFRSLSARLTVQFALLFAAAMLVVSAALSTFIAGSASREVESQLQSSGAVYDRLWQQRAHELQNAAQLLARDFGFRAAVATGDEATMRSALGNAAARLQGRTAPSSSPPTGRFRRSTRRSATAKPRRLWEPLDAGRLTGVAVLAGRPRQLVAAPIMAPTLIGWVVFAADLDAREMRGARAAVGDSAPRRGARQGSGRWSEAAGSMSALERATRPRSPQAMSAAPPRSRCASAATARSRSPSRCRPSRAASARSCCSPIPRRKRWPTRASCSWRLPS